jgi:hypothetical protein
MIPITPYGTQLAAYPFTVASSLPLNIENVMEWFPMPFNLFWGKVFLGLLVGTLILQLLYQFKFRFQLLALAIGGAVMACLHIRFVLLFSPFFAPILAIMLARWIDQYKREKDKYAINFVLMAAVAFLMVWYFPSRSDLEKRVESDFPVHAVEYIQSHQLAGPMYNNYGFGGYLIAKLPEHPVFIDGRGDLYELGGAFGDYIEITKFKPAAFSVLNSYGIRFCLLQRGEPLAVVLATNPAWEQIYQDQTSVIFQRRNTMSAANLATHNVFTGDKHESPAD